VSFPFHVPHWKALRLAPGAKIVVLYPLTAIWLYATLVTVFYSKEVGSMPTIRIDDEVFAVLQKRAQAFVDSPNDVLRRDYGLNGISGGTKAHDVLDAPSFPTGQRQPVPTRRKAMGRILRGEKTPQAEYVIPVLQALVEAGGRGRAADIVDRVGEIMKGRLKEYDYRTLSAGEIRWRNTAEWCRNTMVNKMSPPLLNPSSDHGWWEITDDGREYLKSA
jgi:hypothetical protein